MDNQLLYFLNTQGVFVMIFGVLLFLFITEKKREVFNHTLIVFVITLFVCIVLKELFNFPRPFIQNTAIKPAAGLTLFPSFPSAHAAISFSVATIVSLHKRRLGMFLLILSSLISIGRVAARVHYPMDIAFGLLLGVTIAMFFDKLHVRSLKNLKKKGLTS